MPDRYPAPDPAPTPRELLSFIDGAICDIWYDDHERSLRIRNLDDTGGALDIVPPPGWPDDTLTRYRITVTPVALGSDHPVEISRDQWLRVSWRCDTCRWVGHDIGSEMTARAEHAQVAAYIASGRWAPAPAETSAEGATDA